MLPTNFKAGKAIDFTSNLKAYIIKNYDASCFDKNVEAFITEVQQNRSVIGNLTELPKNIDSIKTKKEILTQYINNLILIKSKMTFGKEDYCIKMEFGWKDTLKGSMWTSYNINFEYYSNLFNLGVMNFLLAKLTTIDGDDDAKLKESIKYYQYAAGLFDTIKNEASTAIPAKELPLDLTPNYMTFCAHLCVAYGQVNLLQVANKKKTNFDLQAQLSKGIEDMFGGAYNLMCDSLKKFGDDNTRCYVLNRKNYYFAMTYKKLRDKQMEEFDKNGKEYGKAIAYQAALVEALKVCEKDNKKIKALIAKDELKSDNEQTIGTEMYEKNNKIYFSPIPEFDTLPKPEKKLMVNPALPPEMKTDVESRRELDPLVPKEVKQMVSEYKSKLNNYITDNLINYENESTVQEFLNGLGLPSSLESILSQSAISDSLWRKINEVKEKGGPMHISNNVQILAKRPEEIEKRINDSLILLQNEEQEDQRLRNQYGSRWTRRESRVLAENYLFTLNDYKNKLSVAQNCDAQTKTDISNNLRFYEMLMLSREELDNKIPKKVDPSTIKNCKEAIDLRKELDDLETEKNNCMDLINKLFTMLNEDNVVPQFIQVLQKKNTENSIFDANKSKYAELFSDLQKVSDKIKESKVSVQAKNEIFLKVKQNTFKPNPENEQFFKNLDNYCQMYHQNDIQLGQGINFYKQFDSKLSELNRTVSDFLMARDMDKNELIKSLTQGGSYVNKAQVVDSGSAGKNYWDFTQTNPNQQQNTYQQYGQQQRPQQPQYSQPSQFSQPQFQQYGQPQPQQQQQHQQPKSNPLRNPLTNMNINSNLNFGKPQQYGQPQQQMPHQQYGQPQQQIPPQQFGHQYIPNQQYNPNQQSNPNLGYGQQPFRQQVPPQPQQQPGNNNFDFSLFSQQNQNQNYK